MVVQLQRGRVNAVEDLLVKGLVEAVAVRDGYSRGALPHVLEGGQLYRRVDSGEDLLAVRGELDEDRVVLSCREAL